MSTRSEITARLEARVCELAVSLREKQRAEAEDPHNDIVHMGQFSASEALMKATDQLIDSRDDS